ncbi:MAG TPA: MFS transporter [Candidatus Sulfotelmatobacter sp.]|nr:MFS transporter [Candidatus Sulfotelmatobacter sp.]
MNPNTSLFASPHRRLAFWGGSTMVGSGVVLHLPMFWMGRMTGFRLAGMPMSGGMFLGMGLIVSGIAAAAYGLLPSGQQKQISNFSVTPPEDAPLTKAHWIQIVLLAIALVVDVMKAASLGFVIPGMRVEYGLGFSAVAVLPFVALLGTTLGSFIWGALADIYGRRAAILLAAVFFVGTSICGAMPSFSWNIVMCFLMGLAAGGMLPVANALLAEIVPTKHRGWCLVLLGGIGTVGGYFATSTCSALLQPFFGWRIMWFLGFPTGLLLIALSPFLPESARFLLQMGRIEEAERMLARYGSMIDIGSSRARPQTADRQGMTASQPTRLWSSVRPLLGLGIALTLAALAWGFVNFGVLLWLPGSLMASGRSVGTTSALIARSTLIAVPTIAMTTYLYTLWSTKRTLAFAIGITTVGLIATLLANNRAFGSVSNPLVSVSLLVVGTSAVISILLPYTSESFPVRLRGRATGWIAGCSKVGGVMAQGLALLTLVPTFALAAGLIAIPTAASLLLVAIFGHETRGRDLRELESEQLRAIDAQNW